MKVDLKRVFTNQKLRFCNHGKHPNLTPSLQVYNSVDFNFHLHKETYDKPKISIIFDLTRKEEKNLEIRVYEHKLANENNKNPKKNQKRIKDDISIDEELSQKVIDEIKSVFTNPNSSIEEKTLLIDFLNSVNKELINTNHLEFNIRKAALGSISNLLGLKPDKLDYDLSKYCEDNNMAFQKYDGGKFYGIALNGIIEYGSINDDIRKKIDNRKFFNQFRKDIKK